MTTFNWEVPGTGYSITLDGTLDGPFLMKCDSDITLEGTVHLGETSYIYIHENRTLTRSGSDNLMLQGQEDVSGTTYNVWVALIPLGAPIFVDFDDSPVKVIYHDEEIYTYHRDESITLSVGVDIP